MMAEAFGGADLVLAIQFKVCEQNSYLCLAEEKVAN